MEEAVGVGGFGAGGLAAVGSLSRISPIRSNGEGAGSVGIPVSSPRSRVKRSPGKAMTDVERKKEVMSARGLRLKKAKNGDAYIGLAFYGIA